MTLPSLTQLELLIAEENVAYWHDAAPLYSSLREFLQRCSSQLHTLKLSAGFYSSDEELLQILSTVPTVAHLELRSLQFQGCMSSFFHSLTLSENPRDDVFLPRLASLRICIDERKNSSRLLWDSGPNSWVNGFPFPDPVDILSMVRSRRISASERLQQYEIRESLTSFDFEVYLDRKRDDCLVEDWAVVNFGRNAEPGFRALAKDGLDLKLRVSSFWSKHHGSEWNLHDHVKY
ncbi:hypothetical protein D9758_002842 [Tetrapyrgos nigripes]|uniref:Uncharacterized protein n=1 Tax=Tetrapyrgos nigripes TaxID=182062 RepID=A0A8H5GQ35_9AGAR|nr:hypothetical protein D9758_002842 [Tetrapyrgos nigripes]